MTDSKYFKSPVHQVVDSLPTDKAAGYRCVLSSDNCLYTLGSDGTWSKDSDIGYGAQVSVIGLNGNTTTQRVYANANSYYNRRSPFFMAGNLYNVFKTVYWGTVVAVIRKYDDNSKSDILFISSNGDTSRYDLGSVNAIKAVVDSNGNLWVATAAHGLIKFEDGDKNYYTTVYKVANNNLIFDTITDIVSDGNELWVIYASGTTFRICHYDGYEWEELSAQFATDTTVDLSKVANINFYCLFVDDDSKIIFTLYDSGITGNMFYYDKDTSTFYKKTNPTGYTTKHFANFVKKDGLVASYTVPTVPVPVRQLVFWDWTTLAIVYAGSSPSFSDLCLVNDEVIMWGDNAAYIVPSNSTEASAFTDIKSDIEAVLTGGATLSLVDVATEATGRITFLNKFDDGDSGSGSGMPGPWENNIIEAVPTPQWIVR